MPKNKFKQGDIVWADFSPSVGQEMKGKHPAVVVSSNSYNEKTNYLMVCPITSRQPFPYLLGLIRISYSWSCKCSSNSNFFQNEIVR